MRLIAAAAGGTGFGLQALLLFRHPFPSVFSSRPSFLSSLFIIVRLVVCPGYKNLNLRLSPSRLTAVTLFQRSRFQISAGFPTVLRFISWRILRANTGKVL
jgi:hypothetical protein